MRNRMPSDWPWFCASHARNSGADAKLNVFICFGTSLSGIGASLALTAPALFLALFLAFLLMSFSPLFLVLLLLAVSPRFGYAALSSCVARWQARGRPRPEALPNQRRDARAAAHRGE